MFSSLESVASLPPDIKPRATSLRSVLLCVTGATVRENGDIPKMASVRRLRDPLNSVLPRECELYPLLWRWNAWAPQSRY